MPREERYTEAEIFLRDNIGIPLVAQGIAVYLGVVSDATPPIDYVLLRYDVTDSPTQYGDGKTKIRESDCDAICVSVGNINDNFAMGNAYEVEKILDDLGISYLTVNNGFDNQTNESNITVTFSYQYARG